MSKNKKQPITYTYVSLEGPPITITAGQDGVTQADITLLRDFDRSTHLNERYEKENRDFKTENLKLKFAKEPEKCIGDPIQELPASNLDIFELIEPKAEQASPMLEKLEGYIELLTQQQKELIYQLYGSKKSLTEIANEQGISAQAIYNRRSKILARLKKMFDEKNND